MHYHVLVPSAESKEALDLLLDLVLDPALEQDSFSMEREVVLEEIAQYRDQPDDQVLQTLLELCCAPHCYGRPILGWENSLRGMNPVGMRSYHHRRYRGANCCLSVAGTIEEGLISHVLNSPLAALDKLTALRPDDPEVLRLLGEVRLGLGKAAEAAQAYESAADASVLDDIDVLQGLKAEDSGKFFAYDGSRIEF